MEKATKINKDNENLCSVGAMAGREKEKQEELISFGAKRLLVSLVLGLGNGV